MIAMTATEFSRNFSRVLDRIEHGGDEIAITRNKHVVAKVIPGVPVVPALDVFSDLYGILSDEEGAAWLADSQACDRPLHEEASDPWE